MAYKIDSSKFLSESEVALLQLKLALAPIRDQLAIRLIQLTGCRPQEALNVTYQDLNQEDRTVLIRGLKGSNDREIPLPAAFFNVLYRDQIGPIFNIKYRMLLCIWHKYRPVKKGLKSLRHTFGVNLYQKTRDIKMVQLALGHKAISNTLVYLDFCYSKEELRKALIDESCEAI